MGIPGFVSKTYLSFYAVLVCEVMAALPRVTEDILTLLLPFLAAGLKGDASKEYTSATLMVLTQLLTRAQLSQDFLKGGCWRAAWDSGDRQAHMRQFVWVTTDELHVLAASVCAPVYAQRFGWRRVCWCFCCAVC